MNYVFAETMVEDTLDVKLEHTVQTQFWFCTKTLKQSLFQKSKLVLPYLGFHHAPQRCGNQTNPHHTEHSSIIANADFRSIVSLFNNTTNQVNIHRFNDWGEEAPSSAFMGTSTSAIWNC
eukprot:1195459-Prorocentrum_minimum.AAC.6